MKVLTHIRYAIDWWLQGLSYFCSPSLKRSMGLSPDKVTIEFNEDHVVVKRNSIDSKEPFEIQRFVETDDIQRMSVLKWLHEQQAKHAKIVLVVSEKIFLKKTLSFPSAAESDLRQVLGFELNRRTPFSQDQAYYDHRVVEHDKQANKLQIELFVVPRQSIDPLLSLLNDWDITVDILRSASDQGDEIEINLLPEDQEGNTKKSSDYVTLFLATAAFALFLAALYVPLVQQTHQLESLEKEVKINRKVAIELQKSRDEKQDIIEQVNFLENKHKNTLRSIELFNEITGIIPDDTWLTRLTIKNGELQIQGESSNASSLVQIIESSERFLDAHFRSPVTQNNVNGKDKFHLSAKLNTIPEDESLVNPVAEKDI
jgi:general secretion pathway protein L